MVPAQKKTMDHPSARRSGSLWGHLLGHDSAHDLGHHPGHRSVGKGKTAQLGALVFATALWLGGIAPALDQAVGNSLVAQAQSGGGGSITLDADVQEANAQTGVVTARGNVRVDYPGRQLQATAQQAQYFSNERRMVLTGDVLVTQTGSNSIRGEVVTYFIDESRFVALPKASEQVRSVYAVPAPAPVTP